MRSVGCDLGTTNLACASAFLWVALLWVGLQADWVRTSVGRPSGRLGRISVGRPSGRLGFAASRQRRRAEARPTGALRGSAFRPTGAHFVGRPSGRRASLHRGKRRRAEARPTGYASCCGSAFRPTGAHFCGSAFRPTGLRCIEAKDVGLKPDPQDMRAVVGRPSGRLGRTSVGRPSGRRASLHRGKRRRAEARPTGYASCCGSAFRPTGAHFCGSAFRPTGFAASRQKASG